MLQDWASRQNFSSKLVVCGPFIRQKFFYLNPSDNRHLCRRFFCLALFTAFNERSKAWHERIFRKIYAVFIDKFSVNEIWFFLKNVKLYFSQWVCRWNNFWLRNVFCALGVHLFPFGGTILIFSYTLFMVFLVSLLFLRFFCMVSFF